MLKYLHSLPGLIKIPQTRCVKNTAMDTYQEILDHWIMCRSSYEAKGRSVLEKIGEFDSPFSLSFSLFLPLTPSHSHLLLLLKFSLIFPFKPLSSLFLTYFLLSVFLNEKSHLASLFQSFVEGKKQKKTKKVACSCNACQPPVIDPQCCRLSLWVLVRSFPV